MGLWSSGYDVSFTPRRSLVRVQSGPLRGRAKMPVLKVRKITEDAKLPAYAHKGDAGMDLFSVADIILSPMHRIAVPTGIEIEIPKGYVGLVWDKSGLSLKEGVKTMGGVIDSSYRGELRVVMVNISSKALLVSKGMKIAQMLIQPIKIAKIREVKRLKNTKRGRNGFGSTGR